MRHLAGILSASQGEAAVKMRSSSIYQAISSGFRQLASHAGRAGESVGKVDGRHGISGVISVPQRILMGPGRTTHESLNPQHSNRTDHNRRRTAGPANANPRILAAQSLPLLGE